MMNGQCTIVDSVNTWNEDGLSWSNDYHVPENWKNPVDYTNGNVYVRIEVLTKPANHSHCKLLCRMMTRHDRQHCKILGSSLVFNAPGVYYGVERLAAVPILVPPDQFDWTEKVNEIQIVIADSTGQMIHPKYETEIRPFIGSPDMTRYFPLTARYEFIVTAEGVEFNAPAWWDKKPVDSMPGR